MTMLVMMMAMVVVVIAGRETICLAGTNGIMTMSERSEMMFDGSGIVVTMC